MNLGLTIKLEVADSAAAFGWQVTPSYEHPDQMSTMQPSSYTATNCVVDKDLGVLMLSPIPLFQNTMLTDWTTTATLSSVDVIGAWQQGMDAQTGYKCLSLVNASNTLEWSAESGDILGANQAWYLNITRGLSALTTTTSPNYDVDTVITIAGDSSSGDVTSEETPANGYPLRLHLPGEKAPFLEYALPDGSGGWTWEGYGSNGVSGTKISKCSDLFNQSGRRLMIYCIPIPELNSVLVDIGNGAERLVLRGKKLKATYSGNDTVSYQEIDNLSIAAGNIKVTGKNGVATIQYLPLNYSTTGTFSYHQIQLSFIYQNNGVIDLSSSVGHSGETYQYYINKLDDVGNLVGYDLYLSGPGTTSPFIPAIYVKFPATYDNSYVNDVMEFTEADISDIEEYEELIENPSSDQDGPLDGWTIVRKVGITFNNAYGQFAATGGRHWACRYSRALTYYDEDSGQMVPFSDYIPFLTGYFGESTSIERLDPNRKFHVVLEDKSWMLKRVAGKVQDYQDGRCYQAVMRYEAEMAGIAPYYISQDPYLGFGSCEYVANPEGCTHYKLPIGTAINPSFSFSPESKYWDNIMRVAGMVHEVVAFDNYGVLCRFPYYDYINNQAPYKGTFLTTDNTTDPNDSSFLMGMPSSSSLKLYANTFNRRTDVTVVGINPQNGERIVSHINADTIMGQGWSETYHGFRDSQYIASRVFTDANTVNTVMASLLGKCLVSSISVEFPTHFLPNLWVLNKVNVEESDYTINGTIPIVITRISRRYSNTGTEILLDGSVTGRWFYNV